MRVAAVQLEVELANLERNLALSEELVRAAARDGAELVALPEFFTTGAAFVPELADRALAPDGAATRMLRHVAGDEGIWLGGSFLCRDADGEVRNAFLLATPGGEIAGRHDKDLPTMWENALYVGGHDDGVIETGDGPAIGAAVCWEYMRSTTARRMRGRVDLVMGGSNWWTTPEWVPDPIERVMEAPNAARARRAPTAFGRYVGAPVVHAAICGAFRCSMPELPGVDYVGRFQGGAQVADALGRVLARREPGEGSGHVVADVEAERVPAAEPVPDRFWMHGRGALPAIAWNTQRIHGRRWYARNVRGRPAYEPRPTEAPATSAAV